MEYLSPDSFLSEWLDIPIVDVRSPIEYSKGHITGAMNIPLFSNEERAKIGTIYKQHGRLQAIQKGLEFVGPKMKNMSEIAESLARDHRLKVYCFRGGMRSEKMSWLFELVGISCYILKGGFKAYRNMLIKDMAAMSNLVVLQGATGSGKTDILSSLAKKGEQVIDLEGMAHHRGSAFGHIGMEEQPTSLQFQNDVYMEIRKLDPKRRVWVEGESLSIGKVYLPESLWASINHAPVVEISIPKEVRIKRLVMDYGSLDRELLIASTQKISRKFGHNNVKDVVDCIHAGDLHRAASLLLDYYDKSYNFSKKKYKLKKPLKVESQSGDPQLNADLVLKKAKENLI